MNISMPNCRTEPFGSALKALGVIKLIGEQKDPTIKSYWENGELNIETTLTKDQIVSFFMEEYSPSPILAPWLSQSGFWPSFKSNDMEDIKNSKLKRFESLSDNINKIESIIKQIASYKGFELVKLQGKKKLEKEEKKKLEKFRNENKEMLITICRNQLDDRYVYWSDSAVILDSEGEVRYPPINGTGGNDARLEFTHTFIEMVAEMLLKIGNKDKLISSELLDNSLFGAFTDNLKNDVSAGKFMPGFIGGVNQDEGIESDKSITNPWDIILFMEGITMWTSSLDRKSEVTDSLPISPFTVKLSKPYSSADPSKSKSVELWFPIWENPASLDEIKTIFKEGRSDIRKRTASNGLEFVESVNSLGVDRGIKEFVRYSLSEKNGQATFLIPLGKYKVKLNKYYDLILDLRPLLSTIDFFMGKNKDKLPPSFKIARDEIEKSIFDFTVLADKYNAKKVIISIGKFERLLSLHLPLMSESDMPPLSGISPKWLDVIDDNTIEIRIALAISSIMDNNRNGLKNIGSIRSNLESIEEKSGKCSWSKENNETVWTGNNIYEKIINTLYRRLLNAEKYNLYNLPIYSTFKLSISEIYEFIHGNFDANLLEELIFGLLTINKNSNEFSNYVSNLTEKNVPYVPVPFDFSLLKMVFLPEDLEIGNKEKVHIIPEFGIIQLLKSGRVEDACRLAKNRLLSSNLKPINTIFPNLESNYGLKLAAAMLLPVRQKDLINIVLIKDKGDGI